MIWSPQELQGQIRRLAQQAISRAAGAPLVGGNAGRILRDASENYPAWLEAIGKARRHIYFESYIIGDDGTGKQFLEAMIERARAGVRVRLLYDWLGCLNVGSRFFRPLVQAGGEVRTFNPPRWDSPFGWVSRDHRKMIAVDSEIGFVTGLCASDKWLGNPAKRIEPWRDTGVEVRGPAVADIERAFAEVWDVCGSPFRPEELTTCESIPPSGELMLRVISTVPSQAALYRLDQFIAAVAQNRLWLADAYFAATAPYVQALRSAAMDGVDVRLLVPGTSDLPLLRPVSTSGYRPLLEAGVRVFEWGGSMMHAKTAVADGHWSRIGSSNLNVASWMGNYELDVSIDDEAFGARMEEMYLQDLEHSTEIVLKERNRVQKTGPAPGATPRRRGGSASRAAASALRFTNTVGAAIANRRVLARAEAKIMVGGALLLLLLSAIMFAWPQIPAYLLCFLTLWFAITLLAKAWGLKKTQRH